MVPMQLSKPPPSCSQTEAKLGLRELFLIFRCSRVGMMCCQIKILSLTGRFNIWMKRNEKITGLCSQHIVDRILFAQRCANSAKSIAFNAGAKIRFDRLSWRRRKYVYFRSGWWASQTTDKRRRHSEESDRSLALLSIPNLVAGWKSTCFHGIKLSRFRDRIEI